MKSYAIEFSAIYEYNTLKTGITLPVLLRRDSLAVDFEAKLDTGSSHCIFARNLGENLDLEIESGLPEKFATAVGSFTAYGHELTISVFGIETFTTVYFAADEHFARNVLGRQGWLDRVKLGLVDYEGKLFLSPYNEVV
jgi:hypothetical protein